MKKVVVLGLLILAFVIITVNAQTCTTCTSSIECNIGETCVGGCCKTNCDFCDTNIDCNIDQACNGGCCEAIPCTVDADCPLACVTPPSPLTPAMACNTCEAGFCVDPCINTAACGDQVCVSPSQNIECTGIGNPPDCNCKDCLPALASNPCGNCISNLVCTKDADCAAQSSFYDQCLLGRCVEGTPGVDRPFCNPTNLNCIAPGMGQVITQCICTTNANCNDGNACTADVCSSGTCSNTPISCNDGVGCTDDSCNPATGCVNTANNANCDDADVCNGLETCDPTLDCQAGTPLNCNDGIFCTDDTCNPLTGCINTANNANCDDGLACNGVETCNPTLDCQPGTGINCDDGLPCTIDTCNDPAGTCSNVCTTGDPDGDGICT